RESYRNFLAGEPYDLSWMQDWLAMVKGATEEGRRFTRVRVVDLPLSDYNLWSYVIAQHNITAGEDIRYLWAQRAREEGLPNYDYWWFESRKLLRIYFDGSDRFLGGEIIKDAAEIVRHNYWRDVAWHRAVRRDEFATEEQSGRP